MRFPEQACRQLSINLFRSAVTFSSSGNSSSRPLAASSKSTTAFLIISVASSTAACKLWLFATYNKGIKVTSWFCACFQSMIHDAGVGEGVRKDDGNC